MMKIPFRCGTCHALLFMADDFAIAGQLDIKMSTLQDDQFIEAHQVRPERQKGVFRRMIMHLDTISPTRTPAGYMGGKRNLSKQLVSMISSISHDCYVEPFVGMGGVFFKPERRPKSEVINDISCDVANLSRLLQRHYPQLMDTLKWQLSSRAEFSRLNSVDPHNLTDLERAARFIYLQRLAFGGRIVGRGFGVATTNGARFDLTKLAPMLEDIHERLSGVVIECLSYDKLINRYDRPHTLFYIDPPCWGHETDYGVGVFCRDDFQRLSDQLRTLKGHFILSINAVDAVRKIFAWADIEEVELTYRVSGKTTLAKELIISKLKPQ